MSKTEKEVIEEMQFVAEQMRLDDIEENPDIINDYFECDACGQRKCLAGSIKYGDFRLCNDCVLLAEVGFELKKLDKIEDFIDKMEDKRLENLCDFIKQDEKNIKN